MFRLLFSNYLVRLLLFTLVIGTIPVVALGEPVVYSRERQCAAESQC